MRGMCVDSSVEVRYRLVSRNCKRKTRVSIARWICLNWERLGNGIEVMSDCVSDFENELKESGSIPAGSTIFFVLYDPVLYGWIFLFPRNL